MTSAKVDSLTLDSIEHFQSSLSALGFSAATVKAYRSDLTMLLQETSCPTISLTDLEQVVPTWLNQSQKNNLKPRTVERRLSSVRRFCKWAGIPGVFLSEYRLPKGAAPEPHPLPGGLADVRRVIEATSLIVTSPQRHQYCVGVIALCGLAGLRISEALAVRSADIRPNNDRTHFIIEVHGKGNKVRYVPVSPALFALIQDRYVMATGTDETLFPLDDRTARDMITRAGQLAGIKRPIASHDLRMTFATEVYNKTRDIRLVQQLLGHADTKTTTGYIAVNMQDMLRGVALEEAE